MLKCKEFTRSEIYYPAYSNWNEKMRKQADDDAAPIGTQIQKWLDLNTEVKIHSMAISGEGYKSKAIIIYDQTGN